MMNNLNLLDVAYQLARSLPFFILFLLPHIVDNFIGYSAILVLPLAYIFLFFSNSCWIELKSRYEADSLAFDQTISKNNRYSRSRIKLGVFSVLGSTINFYVSVFISLVVVINGLSMHCVLIKWFIEDVVSTSFFYHIEFNRTNQTSNAESRNPGVVIIPVEVFINFAYFSVLVLAKISKNSVNKRLCGPEMQEDDNSDAPGLKLRRAGFMIICLLLFVIFILPVLALSPSLANCRDFLATFTFDKFVMVLSITSAGFLSHLSNEFTHFDVKASTRRTKLPKNIIEISAMVIISTLFLISVEFLARPDCERLLNTILLVDPVFYVQIIKRASFLVICIILFWFSHRFFTACSSNLVEILTFLHNDHVTHSRSTEMQLDERSLSTNNRSNFSRLSYELLTETSGSVSELAKSDLNMCDCLRLESRQRMIIYLVTYGICFLISVLQLGVMSKEGQVAIWTLSFLVVNLSIVGTCLLVNYFPYQVLINSTPKRTQTNGVLSKENAPLIDQEPAIMTPAAQTSSDEQGEKEGMDEGSLIDTVFAEHKQEQRNMALSDRSLCFGEHQPSMNSALKATTGFSLFISTSTFLTIIINFAQSELTYFRSASRDWLKILSLLLPVVFLVSLNALLVIVAFVRNARETIYIKLLKHKSILLPHSHLALSFLSVYLIFKFQYRFIVLFLAYLVLFVVSLLLYRFVFLRLFVTKAETRVRIYKNSRSETPINQNRDVFSIDV